MKSNLFKKIAFAAVSTVMAASVAISMTACGNGNNPNHTVGSFDNENDPLVFSTLALDEVFNPFYSTSGTDSNMVGMTQISMLANDGKGEYSYGDEEPVVTKDLQITNNGGVKDNGLETTYYFVLKNNVKFQNGSPLTIKDVLFNYYVYLDPVYTGSSTIYSTDIKGLAKYRTQQDTQKEQDAFMTQFQNQARTRMTALASATDAIYEEEGNQDSLTLDQFKDKLAEYQANNSSSVNTYFANIVEDYDKMLELFREEVNTDYTNALDAYDQTVFTSKDGTINRNLLKSDLEQFLYNEGYITWDKNNSELVCNVDTNMDTLRDRKDNNGNAYWTKDRAIDYVINDNVPYKSNDVLYYWGTSSTLFDYLTNDELSKYNEEHKDEIKYTNIEGIQFANKDQAVTVNGVEYAAITSDKRNEDGSVKEGYNEVLAITINNIDPKAIWNFAIGVAPLYYYSDAEHIAAFNYTDSFGVERGNQRWYETTVKSKQVPVGAGPYAASNAADNVDVDAGDVPEKGLFFQNGIVYFERNNFYLGGAAKIRKIRFQVSPAVGMTNALYTGQMDFVEPNAKSETIDEINNRRDGGENIDHQEVPTLGYGYVGINAGKVPDLEVRQAIMHSININECVAYYKTYAEPIYRSMSKESWAYPEQATAYYPYVGAPVPDNLDVVNPNYKEYVTRLGLKAGDVMTAEQQQNFIRFLVEDKAKYKINGDGVYQKGNDILKYTFTIVGEETDHPAWNALFHAGQFLTDVGFDINTTPDAQGLKKLNSGDLTVWAAAWGATIDPDMYQVYHMDSKATSVLNWGYRQILQNNAGKYNREKKMVEDLSDLIDEAREVEGNDARKPIYESALNKLMELAVELPTYQRVDLYAYNTYKIDVNSFYQYPTAFKGLTTYMHTVSLNVAQ